MVTPPTWYAVHLNDTSEGKVTQNYVENIRSSGLTIYDPVEIGDPALWIPTPDLERLLQTALGGTSLAGLPNRTRSKAVKELVCQALGYPIPARFIRTRPRFPGQMFDTYSQKANNLQVYNEQVSPTRRYVVVILDSRWSIALIRVVSGVDLAKLDTTGTLTRKYQARLDPARPSVAPFAERDTDRLQGITSSAISVGSATRPVDAPDANRLFDIGTIFERLVPLVGQSFADPGHDQERNRGAALHALVCRRLGYSDYADDGRFPDIRHQLLEVKLQTATTIDLGLVRPDSDALLDVPQLVGRQVRHCDVRYAVFFASTDNRTVTLQSLHLATGLGFYAQFQPFGGNISNDKLQIRLPSDFFT